MRGTRLGEWRSVQIDILNLLIMNESVQLQATLVAKVVTRNMDSLIPAQRSPAE